ncbi:MAG: PaaI family thioesterase [Bacteroidota bacterium]
MTSEEHFRKLEHMYIHSAPINQFYKPTLNISKGEAEIIIQIDQKFFHAANAVHGSVYFKMLDDAAFFAANSLVQDVFVLTSNFNIQLLRPVVYGKLTAVGKVVYNARKSFVADAILYNEQEKEIARGTGNFVKSQIALNEEIGYK